MMDNDTLLVGFDEHQRMRLRVMHLKRGEEIVGYCYRCGDWAMAPRYPPTGA